MTTMIMKQSRRLVDLSSRLLRTRNHTGRGLSSTSSSSSSSSLRLARPPSRTTAPSSSSSPLQQAAFTPSKPSFPPGRSSIQKRKPFHKKKKRGNEQQARHVPPGAILAKHLAAAGEKIPTSCWVTIEGMSAVVSLDFIISAVQNALDQEAAKGIVDLDAPWNHIQDESVPFCSFDDDDDDAGQIEWVKQARVDLSLFARPTSWLLKFQNRSIVHALLTHTKETKIFFPMRGTVTEYHNNNNNKNNDDEKMTVLNQHYDVSDATLRVEGCSPYTKEIHMINMFSRYDLRPAEKGPPIEEWRPRVVQRDENKRVYVPKIFLVHFEDASWARAALRERQSFRIREGNELGKELTLAQYPKQKI